MTIPAISPVQFGRYRFFSYIRINEYLKSIIWKYITLKPVSLTGCWDVSKVYRHAWTGCMRKMRIKGLVSDWTVRMSACALTFLPVPLQTLRDTGRLAFTQVQRKFYYKPEDVERLMTYVGMRRKEKAVRDRRKSNNF